MSKFDENAAVDALSANGVHPILSQYLINNKILSPHSTLSTRRAVELALRLVDRLGIVEWHTPSFNGSPNLPYITVAFGYSPVDIDECKTFIYRGDDVDALIVALQERFRPTALPIRETADRTWRLRGQGIPAPCRQPPAVRRTPAFPAGFTWTDPKTGLEHTLENGA